MQDPNTLNRNQAIDGLKTLRTEWEEAIEGASLQEAKGSVGLLLEDAAQAIGLDNEERDYILGHNQD